MNKVKSYIYSVTILIGIILISPYIIKYISYINKPLYKDDTLLIENNILKDRIEYLENTLTNYEKELNNLPLYNKYNYIKGVVSLRNIYKFYNEIVVYTDYMVSKDSLVINKDGLIGIVKSCNKVSANIDLLYNIDNLSIRVNDSYGVLNGYDKKSNLFIVNTVSNYSNIVIGDKVYTSGFDNYMGNIYIGDVYDIDNNGIENILYIKSNVDFNNIEYVYIIK